MDMKTKKALIEAYRKAPPPAGVFRIRWQDRSWYQASVNMPALWNRLAFQLDLGAHPDAELQRMWTQQGRDAFVYEVISEYRPKEEETAEETREALEVLLQLCRSEAP